MEVKDLTEAQRWALTAKSMNGSVATELRDAGLIHIFMDLEGATFDLTRLGLALREKLLKEEEK